MAIFKIACLIVFVYLIGFISSQVSANEKLSLSKVSRTVDISSQLARVTSEITLENTGDSSINSFTHVVEESMASKLSYLAVTIKDKSDEDTLLDAKEKSPRNGDRYFSVSLSKALAAKGKATVTVEEVFSNAIEPYPAKIGQSEKQLVVFTGNHYFYSIYPATTQTTTVKLSSATIESHSKLKPFNVNDKTITYGPYTDIKAYARNEMRVHYENNNPFLTVVDMTRLIEVSHWGNIAVEETYHIRHTGAELKGTFSRYDYQRTQTYSVIKSFKTILPAAAKDVYYRDEIGNISTSNMLSLDDSVELEVRPRFPLFGGWQTKYYIGYNVPAYEYLYNKGDNYLLKMRFVDHVFDDFLIDSLTVKVVLPEGVKDINVDTPFSVEHLPNERLSTYLDLGGRPVVVLKKTNVVENHIQDFELKYSFKKVLLLQEPLLVVAALLVVFAVVIVIVRLDFSISKDAQQESKLKAAGLLEETLSLLDRRSGMYRNFEAAIDQLKSQRDVNAFNAAVKKCNTDYASLTQKISNIQAALTKEDADVADRLHDVQKKEADRKQLLDQAIALALKLVNGKINKSQYVDSESSNASKREKLSESMDAVVASF